MAAKTASPKVKTSDFDDVPARGAKLFLIDGSSLAYRSFFALPQEIATSDGRPTNALLGFSNMLVKLLTEYEPETVIVAWDVSGDTERRKEYAEYKTQRPPMPDLLSEQWPLFKPLVEAFGFTNVSMQGYEADDVIGTLSKEASDAGIRTCIVTYDRDAMQLVDDNVVVMMTTKGVSEIAAFTPERVFRRYDVEPKQIADFIALRGDTSDNIPGIPGIGDKTAAELLGKFGTLDEILGNIDKVTGAKRKENLTEFSDQARIAQKLATIVRDLPLDVDLNALVAAPPDRSKMLEMFHTYEFRTLARRVEEMDLGSIGAGSGGSSSAPEGAGNSDGSGTGAQAGGGAPLTPARLVSPQELTSILAANPQPDTGMPIAVRWDANDDQAPVVVAVEVIEGVPDGGKTNNWIAVMQGSIRSVAEAIAGQSVVAFDYKALPQILRAGGDVNGASAAAVGLVDDVMLSTYLLQPGRKNYIATEVISEEGLTTRLAFSSDERELVSAAQEAASLSALRDRQHEKLESTGSFELYRDIELPVARVLADIEALGICIDAYRMGEIGAKVADQLDELVDRAHELAGKEFNLGSPKQLATVLFEDLGLPAQRSGKTGYSTDQRVLRDLRDMHPIIGVIESWRELSKLKSTYLDVLPALVDAKTGRIHTTFNQTTAATGRLSSINPNLQNIPVRTSVGHEIRSAFVPAEGCSFVSCDYSQVELRLLAHLSEEPKLIEAFERGDDIHTRTAAEVADVDPAQVSREQRSAAKAINFGIIYGISSFGLSQQLQISREEAQNYIDRYLGRYPYVSDFMERTIERAKEDGYVTTMFGRRRPIPELRSRVYNQRQLGERLAVNTVLQGSAADIMKIAMIRVHDELQKQGLKARIILQIHDELLIESPDDEIKQVLAIAKKEMAAAAETKPPLDVDGGFGSSWLDAK